jgi:hypothetical protein
MPAPGPAMPGTQPTATPRRSARSWRLALSLAGLLAGAAPELARADAWVLVRGGAYLPTASFGGAPWDAAPAVALAGGYDSGFVGAGVEVWYLPTRASLLESSATPFLATLRLRLPLGVVTPYAFGSAGVAFTRANLGLIQYTASAFAGMAGLGVDFPVGEFTLGVQGGWLWLSPAYSIGTFDLDGATVTAHVGVRF